MVGVRRILGPRRAQAGRLAQRWRRAGTRFRWAEDGGVGRPVTFLRTYATLTRALVRLSLALAVVLALAYLVVPELVLRGLVVPGLVAPGPVLGDVAPGPGTHPLTLACAAALAVALLRTPVSKRMAGWVLALYGLVAAVGIYRLWFAVAHPDGAWAQTLMHTAWSRGAGGAQAGDLSVELAANTALTLLMVAAAQILRHMSWAPAFLLAVLAPLPPFISTIGYAFGVDRLHDQMAPATIVLLMPLAFAGIVHFVSRPGLRSVFLRKRLSRVIRAQLALGAVVPFGLGAVFARFQDGVGPDVLSILVALILWFVLLLIGFGGWWLERTDQARRRYERRLAELSVTDQLTGCRNRWSMETDLRSRAPGGDRGVLLVDIDHFKSINDRHGHAVGDAVLRRIGQVFRDALRPTDMVIRWGGEEFLIVLNDTRAERVLDVAERLRDRIGRLEIAPLPPGAVTVSIGAVQAMEEDQTLETAIAQADRALYGAKDMGRNRVIAAQPVPAAGARGGARAGKGSGGGWEPA